MQRVNIKFTNEVNEKNEAAISLYKKAEFEEVQKKVEEITSTGGEPNVQSDWNTTNEEADSFIKNKPDLSIYADNTTPETSSLVARPLMS